jgi:NDP-sugar pyrophosphorylase family protein
MAGGYGTRLAELGTVTPKPLQLVGGKTLLARAVSWLCKNFTLSRVVVVAHHRAERIAEEVAKLHNPLVGCVNEGEHKLGTAGFVTNLASSLPLNYRMVVVNADVLTTWTPPHVSGNWVATVGRQVDVPFGSVEADENGALIGVREKWTEYQAYAGVCQLEVQCVRMAYPNPVAADMPDLLNALVALKTYCSVQVYKMGPAYWRDIATPADLYKAQADAEAGRI